ncbi:MAG: PQQ-dependent sugar dehydrogenase [Candidatus Promineifilaceae bacterium]
MRSQPRRRWLWLAGVAAVTLLALASLSSANLGATGPAGALTLGLEPFASGLISPIGIANAGDERLFILEQAGIIRIVLPDGTVLPEPFLEITDRVDDGGNEEGLLGLAFHPQYTANGYFYVNYTYDPNGTSPGWTRISRFSVTADPDVADPGSEQVLLTVVQPASNHNAGHILFGPDGYLYVPLGDGGGAGDIADNAQNPALLLGKVSRIDVDSGPGDLPDCVGDGAGAYTVPAGNPFVDGPGGACDEIWALGLRNPWRSSFDRLTGDLYIGDVGQNVWEEIDFQPAASAGGENYGWRCYEGNHAYNTDGCLPAPNYTFPIFEYQHSAGNCTVIGGYVYRGDQYPAMAGRYLLLDFCSGNFWDLRQESGDWLATLHTNLQSPFNYAAFGEAANGELYVAGRSTGQIYRLTENSAPPTVTPSPSVVPSATPSPTPTATPSVSPTPTSTPSVFKYAPVLLKD